ncbi:MAG: putative quinol monooxygenase [Acidimicrobiia bacterium]
MPDEIELAILVGRFEAAPGREEALAAVLAKYVVLTRRRDGCRNVDLVASVLHPGRYVVIEKWASPETPRNHLDHPETLEMAEAATPLLAGPPDLDLHDAVTAQDLETPPG